MVAGDPAELPCHRRCPPGLGERGQRHRRVGVGTINLVKHPGYFSPLTVHWDGSAWTNQRAVPALGAQGFDVCASGFGDPQPVER
jgi:hypothetical protein